MIPYPVVGLADAIVWLLMRRANLSANDLHTVLSEQYMSCTVQAVYKESRRLQKEGVVFKAGQRFVLSTGWILDLVAAADTAQSMLFSPQHIAVALKGTAPKARWQFNSLQMLDGFWVNLIMLLLKQSDQVQMFQWIPHPWFLLSGVQTEQQLQRFLKREKKKGYLIIGNDTLLRKQERPRNLVPYEIATAPGPFSNLPDTYLTVIGDTLVTVRLAPKLNQTVAKVCSTAANKVSHGLGVDLLTMRSKVTLSISTATPKVKQIRRQFQQFFGMKSA